MGVGLRLKMALRERKMTIKELSAQSSISLNTLYSITKRDTENVDDVILSMIADTLGLSWSFFCSCPPFEDLDFLQRNKEAILLDLEKSGLFSRNGRSFIDVGNYEFWEVISNNVFDVIEDKDGRIQVLCEPLFDSVSNSDDDNSPFAFYYLDENEVVQKLLDVFLKLDRDWQKEVIEDAEIYLDFQEKRKAKAQRLEQEGK